MQRENTAETLALDGRAQRVQGCVGSARPLLCPGNQERLQELGQTLVRQRQEFLFGGVPIARFCFLAGNQQLRHLAVRHLASQSYCFWPASVDAGDERLEE